MEHNGPLVLQSGAASSHCHWAIWLSPFPSSPLSPSTFYLILDFVHSHGLAWSKSRRKRGKREVLHYALCCGEKVRGWLHLHGSLLTPPASSESSDIEWAIEWRKRVSCLTPPPPPPATSAHNKATITACLVRCPISIAAPSLLSGPLNFSRTFFGLCAFGVATWPSIVFS